MDRATSPTPCLGDRRHRVLPRFPHTAHGRQALSGRDFEDDDAGADAARVLLAFLDVEVEMRQQVGLVEQHDCRVVKHLRVFERFVLTFGDGKNGDLVVFPQVERGRTDEVANVFDQQHVQVVEVEALGAVHDHVGIQMAAGSGVANTGRRRRAG